MPTVPRAQRTIEPGATSVPRITPSATEETFGGGASAAAVNTATQGLTTQVENIVIEQKKQAAELQAQDADLKLSKLETDLGIESKKLYQGVNAPAAIDHVKEGWKIGTEEITKGLTSDYAKRLVKAKSAARYNDLYQSTQVHMASELDKHETQSAKDTLENSQNEAAMNFNNPELVMRSLVTQYGTIDRLASIKGLSKEEKQAMVEKAQDATMKNVIDGYLGNGDSDGAMKFLDSNESLVSDGKITKQYIKTKAEEIKTAKKNALKDYFESSDQQSQLDFFDGKLNLSELQRRRRIGIEVENGISADQGGINEATYNQYQHILIGDDYKALQSKLLRQSEGSVPGTPITDASVFNAIRDIQLNPDRTMTKFEITKLILDKSDKLSRDDGKYLTMMNKGLPPSPKEQHITQQANFIKDYASRYMKDDKKAEALKMEFIKRVENDNVPAGPQMDQIAKEVMETAVKSRFQIPNLTELPHIVLGIKDGIQNLLSPTKKSELKPGVLIKRNSDGSLTMYKQGQQEQKPKK